MGRRVSGARDWAALITVRALPALAGGLAAALVAPDGMSSVAFGLLVWSALALTAHGVRALAPPRGLLPFVAPLLHIVPALAIGVVLALAGASGVIDGLGTATALTIASAAALGGIVAAFAEARVAAARCKRVVVIGCAREAANLSGELQLAGCTGVEVIGFVDCGSHGDRSVGRRLGPLEDLEHLISEHEPDLLLVSSSAPRIDIFRALSDSCLGSSARVLELTAFYENTLGHVPIGAINDAWFQCVMHPNWARTSRAGRIWDVLIALAVAVIAAPLMVVLALLIRRDGGPVLYRQVRIGEGGRPFQMYKLRSMRVETGSPATWSSASDSRVTAVGRFMRKTHVDEIPQLVNVLRGEMSIVGPRPEQPEIVEQLERTIPFYARRHLTRPGVTGWAQVHCGYSGSESGSAWKLSHDLYYLRHRSAFLDLMILTETVRTLFFDRQYVAAQNGLSFVLPDEPAISEAS